MRQECLNDRVGSGEGPRQRQELNDTFIGDFSSMPWENAIALLGDGSQCASWGVLFIFLLIKNGNKIVLDYRTLYLGSFFPAR